jgi:hypothetical protein
MKIVTGKISDSHNVTISDLHVQGSKVAMQPTNSLTLTRTALGLSAELAGRMGD